MKLRIWTEAYRPFVMGGDVHAPVATEVEVGAPVTVSGVDLYVVPSPLTGETHVAEGSTGALVGTSLKEVMADIAAADPRVMADQLKEAAVRAREADAVSPKSFWKLLNANKE